MTAALGLLKNHMQKFQKSWHIGEETLLATAKTWEASIRNELLAFLERNKNHPPIKFILSIDGKIVYFLI